MNNLLIDNKVCYILKNSSSKNIYDIAKCNNIVVLESDLGNCTCGLYLYIQKNKLILLNSNLSDSHKKIVLAHEIGHSILHTKINCAFINRYTYLSLNSYEREANYFSCKLLNEIGLLNDESVCIYTEEISNLDTGFIEVLKSFLR